MYVWAPCVFLTGEQGLSDRLELELWMVVSCQVDPGNRT